MTTPAAPTTTLRLDEANELLTAWAQHRARERGIRLLVLKGRPLSDDGLRAARVSADVDVLVEPARFDEYCAVVLDAGWEEFPSTFASAHFTLHSRSFRKNGWPNSFDVHSEYPGFLRDRVAVFEALWDGRREAAFAHQPCDIPSRAANVLVLALHSLRGTHTQERHRAELQHLQAASFTADERQAIGEVAERTGAATAIPAFLEGIGVAVATDPDLARGAAAREWRRKVAEADGAAASWLLLVARAPWREKPVIVARALWPSRRDFAINHPEIPDRVWPQLHGRLARLGRGFRRLPVVARSRARR
ncbi:nucleotidyltransferase family protein [Microbacterium telephonicum]|uniref:Putative nucleotidyltransferase-like protein n=1 Tax=Microbacterium telephonicum TaxID=1714841 RepID=A0A498BYF8_9MICO|nr:nucleotidyltransferase family protein [Microbacterium telephonicum]RLK48003.1 putative nucleotidyltransferase-like protein [Microbacterium telephonicum]